MVTSIISNKVQLVTKLAKCSLLADLVHITSAFCSQKTRHTKTFCAAKESSKSDHLVQSYSFFSAFVYSIFDAFSWLKLEDLSEASGAAGPACEENKGDECSARPALDRG